MCKSKLLVTMLGMALVACASETPKDPDSAGFVASELTEESIIAAQAAGYTLVNRNGEQVLCRRDAQTGTRLAHSTICLTAREWARARASTRKAVEDMTRGHQPACSLEGNC
jgi:hypothetical protein